MGGRFGFCKRRNIVSGNNETNSNGAWRKVGGSNHQSYFDNRRVFLSLPALGF